MMSNDGNGVPKGRSRQLLRRHASTVLGQDPGQAEAETEPGGKLGQSGITTWRTRLERDWWKALGVMIVVFSAVPIGNEVLGLSTKDYNLWYNVGLAVRQGLDIYPRPETGRLFPFMYPPSAAAMLAPLSVLGKTGMLVVLVLLTSAAWLASIVLSIYLSVGPGRGRHPLVVIVPTLSVIVLVYNIYLLGQPNLLLLALTLVAFACLRQRWNIGAGVLVATAAAIKAFPIMILGYLVYRRMWAASVTTVVVLAAWLLIAPLPFRTPTQAVNDLVVWSQGMVFTYNTHGIAQRPFRSYSYKNQSIMALTHRLLRDVPADGESVLSNKSQSVQNAARAAKGLPPLDPSTDLLNYLKPHASRSASTGRLANAGPVATAGGSAGTGQQTAEPPGRWDDVLQGAEPALRNAWKVNVVDLDFRAVTVVTGVSVLAICLFVLAVLPRANRRTRETNTLEFAMVTLLTTMFSPLSFNYAYVWLLYPTTLGLHLVLSTPKDAPGHRLKVAWISAVVMIPALASPFPQGAQAYGNLFVPALLLLIGLGLKLRALGRLTTAGPSIHNGTGAGARHSQRRTLATIA